MPQETKITKTMMTRVNGRFTKAEDIETITLESTPTQETNTMQTNVNPINIAHEEIANHCNVTQVEETNSRGGKVIKFQGAAPGGKLRSRVGYHSLIKQLREDIVSTGSLNSKQFAVSNTTSTDLVPVNNNLPAVVDQPPAPVFDINERFDFVEKFVQMAARGVHHSVMITGDGGLGKSWTVIKSLEKAGYEDVTTLVAEGIEGDRISPKSYIMVKGYSTASELFKTLYNNRKRTIVFDDCDSVLKDPVGLNILKGALDTHPGKPRFICWNSRRPNSDTTPNTFAFKGSIIFISNLKKENLDQAMRSRSMHVDVSMTSEEKVDRMETIAASPEFLPGFSDQAKSDAINFIRRRKDVITNLNFRTLIIATKLADQFPGEWENMALYQLTS